MAEVKRMGLRHVVAVGFVVLGTAARSVAQDTRHPMQNTTVVPMRNAQVSARMFAEKLYDRYRADGGVEPDYLGRDGANIFSARLYRMVRRDAEDTPRGDAGRLDFDPICSCQDSDGLIVKHIEVSGVSPLSAHATVMLGHPNGTAAKVLLTLIRSGHRWKIDDVGSKDVPSLRKLLGRSPKNTIKR